MTAAAWLCLALLAATFGASPPAPVSADDHAWIHLALEAEPGATSELDLDPPSAAAEECEPPSPAPAVVPEVATLLFLATGGALILARHRHPRRPCR